MSIIVKDMKMPIACGQCPLKETNWYAGLACRVMNRVCPVQSSGEAPSRPEWCPLEEKPKRGRKKNG